MSKNQPTNETAPFEELREDIVSANEQIHSLVNHLNYQTMKIKKIKRIHEDFEHELDILNGKNDNSVPMQDFRKTEFENMGREFESKKIIGDITLTVEKQGRDRIAMLEKQLEDEKANAAQFNKKIQEEVIKFTIIEEALKRDKGELESIIKEKTEMLVNAEKMSAIGDLASRLAHDMKNPLTVIRGSIQVIKKTNQDKMDDFSLKRIKVIEDSIFRMAHQIDNVLNYVKMTQLEITQNSLVEILISAIEQVQVPQNITINLPVSDFVLSCDQNKLIVVFSNIILNSIQAIEMKKG
ncbi:histidine kinase dimerization/phospho-acceptor domain-containing protein [Candidatus Nitrosotenuis sp. DW1]|uniref:histidine kinase dimerization/phospho-acceptor domain-containing protein n=1 Tax=Candidatus Nitrosotenuis sp. DW1 TaxID=2259672 RepID=UPI0015CD2929|nr:histidine kinase dimerization/phospho-acceptor domain-containing protein [Candidatus Nitrosotenuis sp. DW1]